MATPSRSRRRRARRAPYPWPLRSVPSLRSLVLAALVVAALGSAFTPPPVAAPSEGDLGYRAAAVPNGAPDALRMRPIERPELAAEGDLASPFTRASQAPYSLNTRPDRYWAKNHRATPLWASPNSDAPVAAILPEWAWLEYAGQQERGRMFVSTPGDGRLLPPRTGWVSAVDVMVAPEPKSTDLPWAYPATLHPTTIRLHVPYWSQLDGSPWEAANCGPTTLAMVLESLGTSASPAELRRQVLDAQGLWGDDVGVLMEALVEVGAKRGARLMNYFEGSQVKRWGVDDVRSEIRAGRPVVLQVRYRGLPGREESNYYGDHFVVVTGLVGENFLYNDPIDSDGIGFDRIMTPEELQRAMAASDRRYANAGFGVTRF